MLIFAAATLRTSAINGAELTATNLQAEYHQLDADYRRELDHLSHVAFGKGWTKLGDMAHSWQPAPPASGSLVFIAPDEYSLAAHAA